MFSIHNVNNRVKKKATSDGGNDTEGALPKVNASVMAFALKSALSSIAGLLIPKGSNFAMKWPRIYERETVGATRLRNNTFQLSKRIEKNAMEPGKPALNGREVLQRYQAKQTQKKKWYHAEHQATRLTTVQTKQDARTWRSSNARESKTFLYRKSCRLRHKFSVIILEHLRME